MVTREPVLGVIPQIPWCPVRLLSEGSCGFFMKYKKNCASFVLSTTACFYCIGCYRMDLNILCKNSKLRVNSATVMVVCVFSQDCPSKQDLQNSIQQAQKLLSSQEASYMQSLRTLRKKLNLLHDSVTRLPAKPKNCK